MGRLLYGTSALKSTFDAFPKKMNGDIALYIETLKFRFLGEDS